MNHGIGVMSGILESVPDVYRNQYGAAMDMAELHARIPACAQEMFTHMTRMNGNLVVQIEQAMGMMHQSGFIEGHPFSRISFSPDRLRFSAKNGPDMLDIQEQTAVVAEAQSDLRLNRYHGCLAGIVEMPRDPHGSERVFGYMQKLISDEMMSHWAQWKLDRSCE